MNKGAGRTGADLALVQGEHDEAFDSLVEIVVIFAHDVCEEDVRRLAAEFQRDRDDVLGGILHDEAARRRLAGEGDLCDALAGGERLAGFKAKAVDDVKHARWQDVCDQLGEDEDRGGRLLGWLEDDTVAGSERGREFPHGHQQGEVPWDDLADDAKGLVEVIGDGVIVDLADAAFLRADAACEIAEVIDCEWHVCGHGFADGLAIVPGLAGGEQFEVFLHAVRDTVEHQGAFGNRGFAPGILRGMGSIEGKFDV